MSSIQSATIKSDNKIARPKSRAFPINAPNPFRKKILPVTPLDGQFYKHLKSYLTESKDFIQRYPGGGPLNRRVKPEQHPPSQPDVPPEGSERQLFRSRHPESEPQAQREQHPYSPEPRSLAPVHSTPQRSQYEAPSLQLARPRPRA